MSDSSAALEQLLTTEQVAELLQVPVDTVRWWRKRGRGPVHLRIGKYARYRRADVEAWIDQQEVTRPR